MTTYQDRAREVLVRLANYASNRTTDYSGFDADKEEDGKRLDQALSELASIVEGDVIGADDVCSDDCHNWLVGTCYKVERNELRQEQRDQLSNRSKS